MTQHTTPNDSTSDKVTTEKADVPLHHNLATLLVFFKKDDQVNQRHFNATLAVPAPRINREDMDTLIQSIIRRATENFKISPEDIIDVVILGISPLGVMKPSYFTGSTSGEA